MAISDELQNLNNYLLDAYDVIEAKGGILPEYKNAENLATAIGSIGYGTLFYYSGATREWPVPGMQSGCNPEVTDSDHLDTFVEEHNIEGNFYANYGWDLNNNGNFVWRILTAEGEYTVVAENYLYIYESSSDRIRYIQIDDTTFQQALYNSYQGGGSYYSYELAEYAPAPQDDGQGNYWSYRLSWNAADQQWTWTWYDSWGQGWTFTISDSDLSTYWGITVDWVDNTADTEVLLKLEMDATFTVETGVTPNRTRMSNADMTLEPSITVDTTSEVVVLSLASAESIASLSNNDALAGGNVLLDIDGHSIYAKQIKGFAWGAEDASSYMPDYFLGYCSNLTELSTFPSWLTTIPNGFLYNCTSFNQSLDLSNVTTIGNSFLYNCTSFNQSLDPSNVTTIGNSFLRGCYSFNQSLDLSNITSIGVHFLSGCTSFNQPLSLSNVTTVGGYFLNSCTSFNQDFTVPASVTSIATYFMYNCRSMISTVYCNAPAVRAATNNYTLATDVRTAPCYTTGITLAGTYASNWHTRFPDRTSNPYRKTIVLDEEAPEPSPDEDSPS